MKRRDAKATPATIPNAPMFCKRDGLTTEQVLDALRAYYTSKREVK